MEKKIRIKQIAPDFTLDDLHGNPVRLSSFRGEKIILLVFNRGFM